MSHSKLDLQFLHLPNSVPPILATGGELKSAFALARDDCAALSPPFGDLQSYETLLELEQAIEQAEKNYKLSPQIIAYDLHPNYLATRYAVKRAEWEYLTAIGIQHHHAHIAACMADNAHPGDQPVIGISLDGTGYGEDGAIWGGEFLLADYVTYHRFAHLPYVPLPGGDVTVRQPWRMALAWLDAVGIAWEEDLPPVQFSVSRGQSSVGSGQYSVLPLEILRNQLTNRVNTPLTSSMGRLFDAVSALIGVCPVVEYEAQAAIELEKIAAPDEVGMYPFSIDKSQNPITNCQISLSFMFQELLNDFRNGISLPILSARFHNTVAWLIVAICREMRDEYRVHEVALSGGVWQNKTLLQKTIPLLEKDGFEVLVHKQVPTTDAGLPLGQVMVAEAKVNQNRSTVVVTSPLQIKQKSYVPRNPRKNY